LYNKKVLYQTFCNAKIVVIESFETTRLYVIKHIYSKAVLYN